MYNEPPNVYIGIQTTAVLIEFWANFHRQKQNSPDFNKSIIDTLNGGLLISDQVDQHTNFE